MLATFFAAIATHSGECRSNLPPSLSVDLKREFMLSVVLRSTELVLQEILKTETLPKIYCTIAPGVKREVPDIEGQFFGLGFSGVYAHLENDLETLVQVGVITTHQQGRPPHAYFAGGRTKISKALVAALAIAVARLVQSPIVDGSGHWMQQEECSSEELMIAMTSLP